MNVTRKFWITAVCLLVSMNLCLADDTISFWEDRVSVGGEVRGRFEMFDNRYTPNGMANLNDEFFLLRNKLHLDFHPSEDWRVFIEIQDSRQFGSDVFFRHPNFDDDVDIFQAYLDLNVPDSPFSFRLGRQPLVYGKQRLIGGFLWSNTSRTFDALKLSIALPEFYGGKIDVFAAEAVRHQWGELNDIWGNSRLDSTLYGVYSTWNDIPCADFFEGYYLLRDNDSVNDEVHTLGVRGGRKYDSNWDWEIELAGQFGDFRGADHTAFASHVEVGYSFDYAWTPRAALAYNYATGDDDATDGDHGTFDNLYPTNHIHYGQADLFSWRNMHDIELEVSAKPHEQWKAIGEVHFFLLDEPDSDAWYHAGGGALRMAAPGTDPDSFVGTEVDLKVQYQVCDWFKVEGGYSHFFAAGYVNDTGEDDDLDWGYLQATASF